MAKYEITRACGHTETVQITGPVAGRARQAEYEAGKQCYDCYKAEQAKKLDAENVAAAEAAKEAGLPALTGSEKQVAWANTLREKMLAKLAELVAYAKGYAAEHGDDASVARQMCQIEIGAELIRSRTAASWWIDNRSTDGRELIKSLLPEIDAEIAARSTAPSTPAEAVEEQAAQEEALLKPAGEPASAQIADISQRADTLCISFPERNDAFRAAMHALGYKWSATHWAKPLSFRTGEPADRMAEAAHAILAAGFMARLHDVAAREKAVSGDFQPEQRRWVAKGTAGTYAGWYAITWPKSDDLYAPARKLLGSKYANGCIYVPPGSTDEVLDFAEHYGFALSPGARAVADAHLAELARGMVVERPKALESKRVREADTAHPEKLATPENTEVDDELCDKN